jgi:hypothetical protein
MQTDSVIEYKINHLDEIVFLNSSWDNFALENDASELIGEKVVNSSLWSFIAHETTRQLYKDLLKLVRKGNVMRFNFNCDSPGKVRFIEMIISPEENNGALFQTHTLSVEERLSQRILDRNAKRINKLINICGWCKAIDTGDKDWQHLDSGISMLSLFEQDKLPELSHGICNNCYSAMAEKISQRKKSLHF